MRPIFNFRGLFFICRLICASHSHAIDILLNDGFKNQPHGLEIGSVVKSQGSGVEKQGSRVKSAKFHELPILLIFGLGLPNLDLFDYFGLQGQIC